MSGPSLGLALKGDDTQDVDRRQDNPHNTSPRKLQPMGGAKTPGVTKDMRCDTGNQTYGVSQVRGAFVDQLHPDMRNGVLETDSLERGNRQEAANQSGDTAISSGRPTNGDMPKERVSQNLLFSLEGGMAQIDMNKFGIVNGDSAGHSHGRTPSSRGDHSRMQSATSYKVSNPWLGGRNLVNSSRLPNNSAAYNHGPLPARSPRNRQLSAMKKNHMDLIEQQYGRFLSGIDPKRAPSTAAKYLQSLAKSMKGVPSDSAGQLKSGTRQLDRR